MAVPVKIVLYAPDEPTATTAARAAFERIHELNGVLSDYDPESELRGLEVAAGEASPSRLATTCFGCWPGPKR